MSVTRTSHRRRAADGRALRGARTRSKVVEAMLALVEDGILRPTARQVAERAGVSLRSVFQHFEDLESLLAAVADRQFDRLEPLRVKVDDKAHLAHRIDAFVQQRARFLEAITPVRRAALLQESFSAEIARRLHYARSVARDEVAAAFAAELATLEEKESAALLAALDTATDWHAWNHLRTFHGLGAVDAIVVMSRSVAALLKEVT